MIYQPWAFRMLGIAGAPDIVVPQAGVNITNIATKLMNFTMLDNALLDFTLLVNDIEWFILWTLNDRPISLSSQPSLSRLDGCSLQANIEAVVVPSRLVRFHPHFSPN